MNLYVCHESERTHYIAGMIPMLAIGFHSLIDGVIYADIGNGPASFGSAPRSLVPGWSSHKGVLHSQTWQGKGRYVECFKGLLTAMAGPVQSPEKRILLERLDYRDTAFVLSVGIGKSHPPSGLVLRNGAPNVAHG